MAEAPVITSAIPNAPGWITIAWLHSGEGGVLGYRIDRQNPSFSWTTFNNAGNHTDMGLQPSTTYSYRVCAVYSGSEACSEWVAVRTMDPPQTNPPISRPPPTITAHEITPNSITVKWSGRKYDRVHIRWRKNAPGSDPREAQIDIDHEGWEGYRHFPNLETSTPYTFRIQGCDVNFFGVAHCGPWSAPPVPISTAGPVLPPAPVRVAPIYAVMPNGDLMWNRHDGHADGSFKWASEKNKQVGNGWNVEQAFSGGDGIIYAVMPNGDLMWNRHDGREDGTPRWASQSGIKVGVGWGSAAHVFAGHDGVIYAVYNNGQVIWNRHEGRFDGSFKWELEKGRNIANAENKLFFFRAAHVFAGGVPGIIYAIMDDGDLMWFKHYGWWDGSSKWSSPSGKIVGVGWQVKEAFCLRDTNYVYNVMPNNELQWNIHTGFEDGTFSWASEKNKQVGSGWNVKHAFSG
ncbi:MAG: tachylectin-related carbohydrate-binding protein [Chloroflexota bacterium]